MTCIVGLVEDGCVWLGGDSAGVSGSQLVLRRDEKVFAAHGMVFGCTTSFRMTQLLRFALEPPEYPPGSDVPPYLVTAFVDAVRACFKQGGFAKTEQERELGGTFLLGFQGRLFCVQDDYQVGEPADGYAAIGSGDDVACGALFVTRGLGLAPQHRLRLALEAAERHNTDVRAPFVITCLAPDEPGFHQHKDLASREDQRPMTERKTTDEHP